MGIKEVTEHDGQTTRAALSGIIAQHPVQISTALTLQGLKITEQGKDLLPAALWRHRSPQFIGKRHRSHAVQAIETDIAQRRRNPSRIVQLRRSPHLHRLASIDKQMNGQVFFSSKDLEKQPVETAVNIPVDVAEIIPG